MIKLNPANREQHKRKHELQMHSQRNIICHLSIWGVGFSNKRVVMLVMLVVHYIEGAPKL